MPNYIEYQKSISNELISIKNRIRDFIDGRHWGEDGRYKEEILKEVIASKLPSYASVGTGFVVCDNEITSQIDIIVYDNNIPVLFKKGDFVIVSKEAVFGIIEVKTDVSKCFKETIEKSHKNGQMIGKAIFNGIFSYEFDRKIVVDENCVSDTVKTALKENFGQVRYLALGENYFIKYWEDGMPFGEPNNKYRIYEIGQLAFGYFISNLIEDVYIAHYGKSIPENISKMFYPIEGTKEAFKIDGDILE